jgi:putative FmdB family regulatory protein
VPTYQYSCTDCGHFFEAVQSFTDDSLTVCPECEGRLRKVFNAVGVVFKGSGFYRTDSRSQQEGAKASAKEGSNGGSKDGSKDGSKNGAKSDSSSNGTSKTDSKPSTSGSSTSTPSPAA